MTFADLVARARGAGLDAASAEAAMDAMADGAAPAEEIERLLTAPSMTVEAVTPDVLAGFARSIRRRALAVPLPAGGPPVIDTCGTGGGAGTFNVSTAAALVAAGAGLRVAKHGNRAVASRCGSADLLEALGVRIEMTPEAAGRSLAETGFCFLFAPKFHRAFAHVAPVRKRLAERGVRTVFNLIGPLCNPAGVRRQVIGVFRPDLVERIARVVGLLGAERAVVVCGDSPAGPVDEVSTLGATAIAAWDGARVTTRRVEPADLGLERARPEDVAGGDAAANAAAIEAILAGEDGPRADLVAANAGAALVVGGVAADLPGGVARARDVVRSGAARRVLERLRSL
jgi:anthranilate phosphoribosyltransferase